MNFLKDIKFWVGGFSKNERGDTLVFTNPGRTHLVKICLQETPGKLNSLLEEFKILKHLSDKGCATSPRIYEYGKISAAINSTFSSAQNYCDTGKEYSAIVMEYLSDGGRFSHEQSQVSGYYSIPDILFTLIEQWRLGVFQNDIKPENCRFSKETGVVKFIDYDQAVFVDPDLSTEEMLKEANRQDKLRYKQGSFLRRFDTSIRENSHLFDISGRLNLANCQSLKMQRTTNTTSGFYHTLNSRWAFLNGSRSLDTRSKILDEIEFSPGEKVLDVGCNSGLLTHYLRERGCIPTGIDNDQAIIQISKMFANILGITDIHFERADVDEHDDSLYKEFDTVMLFSVFHHTRNPEEVAKNISSRVNRVIIETRLVESGKQPNPSGYGWIDTTKWSFASLDSLCDYFERIFSGFYARVHGQVDKGRFIISLEKR